ncbi:uncharacterized protein LOC116340139 isoform X2 [Contarinia nasturtii]|uniref:uncharacterized protein LOC116340139 isoform X2 n=1 Tax=Contarinia nasturtii TaxID=265458 RepID=UPI0012D4BD0A|nr:uncharacterized protein LOC116340139 isoform X2 [Contarinia nasturtii]
MKSMTIMPDKVHFLCSCSQYVHGSGKPTKKKITCKQCKGIKLPFTPIGGTVRVFSTPYVLDAAVTRNCFGTVRFPPTCENQRPTILCRENDPYNFLRQSRLLSMDRTNDQKLQQCNKFQKNNVHFGPNHMFVNHSTRIFDSLSPSEYHYTRPIFQTTINPYELISSTLHNNEFSTSNLYNMRKNKATANYNSESIVLQNRNDAYSFNNLDLFSDQRTTAEQTKTTSFFLSSQPPPTPAVESLPLSIKAVPNKILNNSEAVNTIQKGLKKIMKETKSVRIENGTLLTGRFKKVQFNTLPELTRPKILAEFQKERDFDLNHSTPEHDDVLSNGQKNHTGMKTTSQRRKPVMRSMSDRRDKDSKAYAYFKDTTALRTKPHRISPHQLFLKTNNTLRHRPSCPPPSCPKDQLAKTEQIIQNQSAPQRPPRQQKPQNKKLSNKPRLLDETKASRIFGLLPVSKTTIEPFPKTMGSLNKQNKQKTSITINSDECSTVNVNDRVKLYHSSVLIRSGTDPENQKELEKSTQDLPNFKNETMGKNNQISHNAAMSDKTPTDLNKTKTLIYLDDTSNSQNKKVVSEENGSSTMKNNVDDSGCDSSIIQSNYFTDSFILKLLNDPFLSHLLYGLEIKSIANIIESSLIKMGTSKYSYNFITRLTKDTDTDKIFVKYLHEIIKEERYLYDLMEAKLNDKGLCEKNKIVPDVKLHDMLSEPKWWKSGECLLKSDIHQYESICFNCDPIYEEINEKPPPLPTNPPPILANTSDYKPMFLGATKYEILSYLVDAKDRVPEEPYTFKFLRRSTNEMKSLEKVPEGNGKAIINIKQVTPHNGSEVRLYETDKFMTSIERNDSGVGSETSKTSRTKYQPGIIENKKNQPIHLCEDCDEAVELHFYGAPDIYLPIVCRNCSKKRTERREILWEFIETEKKYTRDLQIIIDEFYRPMLVAGLLTQNQLSAIFLNIEELLQNSESFCRKIRDALDTANDQGDDDLFTVDIGKIILETSSMLSAFETYCVQQAASSLLLANLEKDKELLKIFLRVSQMENSVLRRMNLNSFLMVILLLNVLSCKQKFEKCCYRKKYQVNQ